MALSAITSAPLTRKQVKELYLNERVFNSFTPVLLNRTSDKRFLDGIKVAGNLGSTPKTDNDFFKLIQNVDPELVIELAFKEALLNAGFTSLKVQNVFFRMFTPDAAPYLFEFDGAFFHLLGQGGRFQGITVNSSTTLAVFCLAKWHDPGQPLHKYVEFQLGCPELKNYPNMQIFVLNKEETLSLYADRKLSYRFKCFLEGVADPEVINKYLLSQETKASALSAPVNAEYNKNPLKFACTNNNRAQKNRKIFSSIILIMLGILLIIAAIALYILK